MEESLDRVMEESLRLEINCYYDLFTPPSGSHPLPLILALHGYGGSKESMMRLVRRINETDFLIASLQGPSHFFIDEGGADRLPKTGFSWRTLHKVQDSLELHHSFLQRVTETLTMRGQADPERVFLIGFSQAAGMNYRYMLTHPNKLRGVVALCGGVPTDLETAPYSPSQTSVLHISTENDRYYPLETARTFSNRISRFCPDTTHLFFPGDHSVPKEAYPVVRDWLLQRI